MQYVNGYPQSISLSILLNMPSKATEHAGRVRYGRRFHVCARLQDYAEGCFVVERHSLTHAQYLVLVENGSRRTTLILECEIASTR